MTRNSLAITIEALSWMAYEGIGERTALLRAAKQLRIESLSDLRQAHKLIMETTRFRNRLDAFVMQAMRGASVEKVPHGIIGFLRTFAYMRYVDGARHKDLLQAAGWAREILGWRDLHPFEASIALLASGTLNAYNNKLSEFERISLETCNPVWFVERTFRVFGRDFALAILRRNLYQMPTYIRLNPLVNAGNSGADREIVTDQATQLPGLDGVWKIDKTSRTPRPDFIRSELTVTQDLAGMIASRVTDVEPNQVVLDICAAPGNKTSHLAALMHNQGEIYSIDISDRRLEHWKTEMKRTGVKIAQAIRGDAIAPPLHLKADVILIDPPCSNTGVFARNPSIKWAITPGRLTDYVAKQRALLRSAAKLVKPEGTLVYCTCSILPEENELVIEDFLHRNGGFELAKQTPFIGSPGLRGLERCQRFYPHLHDCNGYFIAKLNKTA